MAEINETFETYEARIRKALENIDKPIILSTEVKVPILTDGNIKKITIAWPLYTNAHKMFYITIVPAGTHVARHSHGEDIFGLLTKGSLVLNGSIEINEGMWFVVRANTPYEIDTKSGYTCVRGYGQECLALGHGGKHVIDEEGQKES